MAAFGSPAFISFAISGDAGANPVPRQIGCMAFAVNHRAGHSKTPGMQFQAGILFEKLSQNAVKGGVSAARKSAVTNETEGIVFELEKAKHGLSAADIAGENHVVRL